MGLFAETIGWLSDPANWSGPAGIPVRVLEHVEMSLLAVALAAVVAMPGGLAIGHTRKGEFAAVSVANLGRALPSFGILAIVFPFTFRLPGPLGFWPTLIALFVLAIPPILTNTYVGVQTVDRDAVEAARGMGMSEGQVLSGLEVPLAAPLIVAGLRIAAVQVVATATLAALVAWGGLGRYIIDGFQQGDVPMAVAGAVLVAALAIVTELAFGLLERAVTPRTASSISRRMPEPAETATGGTGRGGTAGF